MIFFCAECVELSLMVKRFPFLIWRISAIFSRLTCYFIIWLREEVLYSPVYSEPTDIEFGFGESALVNDLQSSFNAIDTDTDRRPAELTVPWSDVLGRPICFLYPSICPRRKQAELKLQVQCALGSLTRDENRVRYRKTPKSAHAIIAAIRSWRCSTPKAELQDSLPCWNAN